MVRSSFFAKAALLLAVASFLAFGPAAASDRRGGEPRLAPLAFVKFCLAYPSECVVRGQENARLDIGAGSLGTLRAVNEEVNGRIAVDRQLAGRETVASWRLFPSRGNCNDYAVTKRHALLARGLPSSALLLAAVQTPSGEDHLVLIVRGRGEDLVLDNLTPAIRRWSETGYRMLGRQAAGDPRMWES